MKWNILIVLMLLLSGCSLGTDLRAVRKSQATMQQTVQGAYRPLVRCTFEALEAKAEDTRWSVYQLREDDPPTSTRIVAFGPSMDYYVVTVVASITTTFDVLFTPVTPSRTEIEVRTAWPMNKEQFSTSILPLIELCSRQQTATAPSAPTVSAK